MVGVGEGLGFPFMEVPEVVEGVPEHVFQDFKSRLI